MTLGVRFSKDGKKKLVNYVFDKNKKLSTFGVIIFFTLANKVDLSVNSTWKLRLGIWSIEFVWHRIIIGWIDSTFDY
ncbi:MAG: hypothetical protein ACD_72C00098G0007 [uncultured bacterium]|nr:MAG: hypothetical protein ACD_72C00098G0007 [uncultured bacterium]